MDDSFAQLRHDLEYSVARRVDESKLQRNARHIDELQQIVLRLLERLGAIEAAYLVGEQEGFAAGQRAAEK